MTRFFLALSILTLTFVYTSSCSSPSSAASAGGEKVISLWHPFTTEETEVFKEIMAEFEEDYEARTGEKIRIDVQYVSFGDMFTKLRTAAMARITPDVAFLDALKVTDLAFGQALVPIHELEGFKQRYGTIDNAREQFVEASFNAGVVNRAGEVGLYGFPVQTTTVALFWNKEMFREKAAELRAAGLDPNRTPRDWEELVEYGKILNDEERGIYGYGHHSSLWFNFSIFNMYNVGFVEYDENGYPVEDINNPRGKAALERLQSIVNSGVEGGAWKRSALGPDAGFLNERYAMCLTGPWNVESFANAGLDFDIGMIPSPTAEEIERLGLEPRATPAPGETSGAAWSSSNVGGQTGVILRTCEERELAFEIIDYFTSEKIQRRWGSQLGQIPTRRAAWENLDTSKYPFMTKFMEQLAVAKRLPQIPLYGVLENDIFNPQVDLLLQNNQTPDEMMEKMEANMEDQIFEPMRKALDGLRK